MLFLVIVSCPTLVLVDPKQQRIGGQVNCGLPHSTVREYLGWLTVTRMRRGRSKDRVAVLAAGEDFVGAGMSGLAIPAVSLASNAVGESLHIMLDPAMKDR
jgi:hypothetical protein